MAGVSAAPTGPHSHPSISLFPQPFSTVLTGAPRSRLTLPPSSSRSQPRLFRRRSFPNTSAVTSALCAAGPHSGGSGRVAGYYRLSPTAVRDRLTTSRALTAPSTPARSESPRAPLHFSNALRRDITGFSPRHGLRSPPPTALRRSMQWRTHAGGRESADGGMRSAGNGMGGGVQRGEAGETAEGNASFVGTALSQVVKLFLLSQLESCEDLSVTVAGSNRELLSGRIAAVTLSARGAVYKGVRLTSAHVAAANIAVDARGQAQSGSFLCHKFPVHVKAHVSERDFNESLQNPAFHEPFSNLLSLSLPLEPSSLSVRFSDGSLHLNSPNAPSLRLTPKLCPRGRSLEFDRRTDGRSVQSRAPMVDLGPETRISLLEVQQGFLSLRGTFMVIP